MPSEPRPVPIPGPIPDRALERSGVPRTEPAEERARAALALMQDDPRFAAARERLQADASLGALTTYRVGGPATVLVEIQDEDELSAVADAVAATASATLVIGRGSNLVVADAGFAGVAVRLAGRFEEFSFQGPASAPDEEPTCRAGGAVLLPVLARATARAGLTGFEWAVGIPGTIGGAVMMNAGGHGSELANCLVRVRVVDLSAGSGSSRLMTRDDLRLGYRHSALGSSDVVIWAELHLSPGDVEAAEAEVSAIVRWRRDHQPGGANAGSVFANPPGDSAGRLIDSLGLKGLRHGTASVSTKHANFIQADPDGSGDDVAALMAEVQRRVAVATGVWLRPENRLVGFPPDAGPVLAPADATDPEGGA